MKLELKDWAAIAEITASVAVVASLAFVGIQIYGNTQATQAAQYQQLLTLETSMLFDLGKEPKLAQRYNAAFYARDGMNVEDAQAGVYMVLATMRLWEGYYLQYRSGTLSEAVWREREPIVRRL